MDLLDKLSKLKLRQPKGLRQFIFYETSYRFRTWGRYNCVETMEKWKDIWILRVFAYKQMPKGECTYKNITVVEVQRKILGHKEYLTNGNVYNTAMGGRYIEWDKPAEFFKCKKNWEYYGYEMFRTQDAIDDLNIPYCSWDRFKEDRGNLRFIDYITAYLENPKIERLVKQGLSEYVQSLRYLDLTKRKIYDVFKVDKEWEFVIGELPISDILLIRKYGKYVKNLDEFESYKRVYRSTWGYNFLKKYTKHNPFKTIRYLTEKSEENSDKNLESIYDDYLRFAEELGYDLRRNKVLYPENVHKAHNKLMRQHRKLQKERELQKAEENKSKFAVQYKKNKKHIFAGLGFVITPAKTQDELINESKILKHCVRTYADQVAEGKTEILLLRKEDELDIPFVTVEVKGKRITQARGKNNSVPQQEVKDFLQFWSKKNKLEYSY